MPSDVSEFDVLEAVPVGTAPADPEDGDILWPCPYCHRRRRLDRTSSVRVRNRAGRRSEYWVLMCDVCVDRIS